MKTRAIKRAGQSPSRTTRWPGGSQWLRKDCQGKTVHSEMRVRRTSRVLATSIVVAALTLGTTAAANAASETRVDPAPSYKLIDDPSASFSPAKPTSTIARPGGSDTSKSLVSPNATIGDCVKGGVRNSVKKKITPPGGSASYIQVGYSSSVVWSGFGCFTGTFKGSSYAQWMGSKPVNATSITLHDEFSCAAIGGVSISASPGATIVSGVIKWTGTVSNTWRVTHSFSGYSFSGAIITVTESASMTARFGSSFYTTNA